MSEALLTRQRFQEACHGGKTMRAPGLYLPGRARERILFVKLSGGQNRRPLFLWPWGMWKEIIADRVLAGGREHSKSSEVNMMRFRRMCEDDSLSLSLRRRSEKPSRLVSILILTLLPVVTYAADGLPSSPPAGGRAPDPRAIPEKMIEPGKVPPAPSKSDPGIQHMPEKLGDPRGAVKPPDLDPGISKNPDVGSPASKEINPPGATIPQKKPGVR